MVTESVSPNTVTASSKATPCFARLVTAFVGSHSKTKATATSGHLPITERSNDKAKRVGRMLARR